MSLNLTEAWKDVPPPSPSGTQDSAEAASGPPPAPDSRASFLLSPGAEAQQTAPLLGAFGNVQDATDAKDRKNSLLSAFPRQAATPLSPAHPRSLFDSPLTRPLLPSSAPSVSAYKPDPQRIEELHALILHNKQDPELAALLERNPAFRAQAALDDGSMPARALLGQQILREIAGEKYAGEPGFYFLALKEKLPEAATRQEAYAAVYDHYSKVVDNQYEENRKRRAAYQNNRAQVEEAVAHVVSGLWSPADLTARLTPEQLGVYQKEFDTTAIEKAHAAFSFLKQAFSDTPDAGLRRMVSERTAMKITSALSDDDGSGKLMINETAFQLFEGSLKNLMGQVKEETGDKFQFLHNLKIALFNPAIKRDATLGTALQLSGQQDLLVPFAREHNKQVFGLMAQTVRDYETYVKNDKENARVLGLLSTGQDLGNQASDRASFAARTVNCLGSVTGQTLPFFIPYAGWGVALAEAFDDKRNRAYYAGLQPGTAEWSAFIDAAASVAVEKISYGGIGRLSGAGWLMGKLPFMNKTRQALTDSLWKHVLFETGAGIAEETVAEPTAEAIIQWVVRNNLAPLVNLNVGGNYDWNNYWQELQGMLSPDQFAATALFVGGLAGMQAPSLHRSLITYSKNEEMLMTQGIPKEEARRIAAIENDKERIAAARQARGKAWENHDQALKNAKAGMAAFRHLGEVQATIESEAYKYFQQSMHLPLVEEKLDKPGTYAVTVYDRDSGKKKFTQDMTGDQLVALFGQYFSRAEQMEVRRTQSEFAANAFLRAAEATGEIQAQDMLQWGQDNNKDGRNPEAENASTPRQPQTEAPVQDTPSPAQQEKPAPASSDTQETAAADSAPAQKTETETAASLTTLGGFVRAIGAMSQTAFTHLTRIATQEYRRRTDSGMSEQEAAATPFAALSPYVPLSSIMALDQEFGQRLRIGAKTTGEENFKYTRLFKMRTAPGTTPADTLFLLTRGNIGSRELLEDLFEWKLGKITLKDPVRLQAIASLLRDTQASMRQLGFKGQFVEPKGELSDMQIVEAMSKLALSDMLSNADSLPLPQWQKDLLQYHVNTLGDAAYLLHIGQAYNAGRKAGTITQDMADILRDLGHEVHTVFDSARIEQADIQAVMDARAIIDGRDPSGTPTASQIRERQQKDAEEEKARVTTGDKGRERSVPKEAYRHPETISLPEAPSSMQGVFANGASWNPDAGTWLGMVPVDKLHLSPEVPQVKVNSGKKGVVNPLVGDYRADAPPIYVWKRKNGRLEVVSGRHRLDLAQRTGTKNIPAYVYEEDAAHDAKWARLLDYEQNMQDDQADELTAAIYVRETNLTDAELTRRGLTRSGTKSRRGLLIGREAREDLWTRFKSGAIRAQDAEAICLLTQHIQDKARIDAMQTAAANDLARGKSLEFVAAKIQLMAHASADGQMVQGLISFGESFEADMEKAAEYVSLCITTINEHINAIKGVRTISKKGSVLVTEGITAGLSADPAERLKELELLKAMYEKIGLYENLRVRALTWDGHTPPDPIGDHRLDMQAERARAEEEAAALENEENRKASEALTPELTFSLTPSRDLETTFPSLWGQAARELNARGQVSFSLNGSHVAIHTLSEEKMRHVLELGGMPNPAIQIADLDSGPTYYAEIACILHPDRIDPAKTPGARIWRGDAWTRQMPEKISEDGDPWEGYEHGPEEIPWFYDEHGDLREWNQENLDAYMKAKHLESFLPHNMTPDEVLDNYGTDGAALPIIMASQAYAAEFPSLKEALRTDNLSFQLDRHEAETATRQLEDQFKTLLGSCYFEPRSLQHFLIGYWWRDISHENVRDALIGEGLLDDPDTVYDEEENPEEYNDLQSSNDDIAEEVRAFLDACRTSAKIYYEAAPGGWLFPSDFSGFILPSSLGPSLRSELEKYNVPIHTYDLTEQEALTLGNPWTLAKASWLREEVDERRNEAIRSFLEVHDISFSLSGAEERDDPSAFLPHSSPSPDFPLALSPVRLSSSFHAVEQASPVTLAIPASAREDKTQGFSKLARQAFTALREKTRQRTLFANGREKTSEQLKPPLLMPDGRRIYLSNRGWKHIMATSPETRTLAAIGALEPLLASARYMYSVPEFDNASPDQTKSWHYYLAKIRDSLHGPGYVLFTFREDTRGCYLEGVETAAAAALDKTGSASSQVDFGATRRATGRSLPVRTLLSLKQFVNFIDKGGAEAFRAPNGQPSLLAPDQWHLVRTAPFMRYFGDWLRDPSASSVVLDDNGEPRVCYRGLKQSYNPGVRRNYTWISSSRELSEQYAAGGTVLDLFVATRRPFHFPDSLTRQSPEHFRENIRRQLEQDRALGFFAEEQLQEATRKLETLLQGTEETEAFKIWERHRELKDILSSLGYDSVMTEESGVMTYGLFRPGQAKSAVGNCGSYDITLSDITFALTPREQRTAAQALVEDTFLRAPDGTPTALTERQWLQVNSAAFKKWFGQSKVVNAHGEPVIVYHGTARKDRVGTVFRPERATSGPMAFFTDSPEIASNYSRNKTDTSIDYEEEDYHDYHRQFRVTLPSGRDIPLERYWNYLSPEERQRIARTAGHIRTDWEGDDSIILDPSADEANGGFRFHLQEARGNVLRALVYHWLDSATLFGQEERFLDVLSKLDLPIAPWYRDPDYTEPGVYACYLHMEHPFRTNGITGKILTSLKAASRKAGNPAQKGGLLSWSKNDLAPETWIDILEEDVKNGTTYAWTTIPDWVTACLKRLGYDGIIDQGGKFHSDIHTVYIPFSPYQLKSATDNNGSFDSGNPDISFALSPEERLITEQAKADGTWLQAPNGQPSLLEPKLWATVRTRAFRDWFGDWLRAPEQSSRVVDVNGEPLPVYHGSHRAGFTIFDTALGENPSQFGTPDDCYFFSDSRQVAITYCKLEDPASAREAELPALSVLAGQRTLFPAVYTCFINIRLPLEADFQGNYWDGRDAEDTSGEGDVPTTNTIALEAREQGYDATIIRNVIDMGDDAPYHLPSTVYSVFDPSQIKSAYANRGSFESGNPDITFALSPEERLIAKQAKADGTWLQAPNGQPSLLEPKLWATVRTRAFRDWFGDWLHAPEQSSRVVDDNGEPLVIYHGSNFKFTEFDLSLAGNNYDRQDLDHGFIFTTTDDDYADHAAKIAREFENERRFARGEKLLGEKSQRQYALFANLRNPLVYDLDAHPVELFQGFPQTEPDAWDSPRFALQAQKEFREGDAGGRDYDGIILKGRESSWILAAQSSQLKSATHNHGTFDSLDPDITFSLWDDAEDSYTVMERSASPLTAEEQSILARARDAGNDLLAPNGQPTRLTEKQWAQARTKAFLAWFGDWLHDPANASKTLDENGEPIVLYHGGSFDIRRSPSVFDGVPHVDGIFFSDSTELAKSYQAYQGGGITTAWLNLKNPFFAQDEASARLPWVDRYIDYWQEEEGWTDRYSGESMDRESVRDMIREGSLYEYDMGQRWSDFLGWVREHHDGYLGHDPTDMGALIAVAFKSTQVKSSEYNSGAFSASEPDITFSLSNLAAIHSLDEEKFLAVDKLGGLPLPSIAVTRLDRPYTWGGEGNIYLVGSPALADPARGVEIHDRDAWSGYFPKLRWSRQEEKEREDFYNQAQEAALRYYGGTDISTLRFLKNALDGDHRGELENKLRHNDFSLAVFAAERGYSPRPVTAKIPGRLNTGDKIFYAEIRKMLPWKDANTLSPDRQDDFCKAMERAIERYRSQFSQDSRDAQLTVPQTLTRKSNLRAMEKELREARGDGFQSISYLALQDARQAGKKALDSHANYKRFEKYAAQHKKAFNAWVEDKLARWLNPVPRIRETGLPATLENITRHMLESKGMGAERGLVFSTGLLRARQARRFNSLEEIKASRNNLVTTEEEKASQQKAQDLIHQFQMALSRIDGSFSAFDNAVKALSLVRGAPTPQKVLAALCRLYRGTSFQGRIARDSRLPGLGSAALSALHAELRDYYEAVPRRSVQLREFSHAVLPAALRKSKQVRDVLKRHQIRPLYHDGTREGRFQALASLIGSSASFSLTSLEEIVSGLAAPSMQATRASELVKDFGKAAENWRRVMSGKEEKPSARVGAELFGMINSLISSARYVLPKGYRSNVDLQMQWASVYAAMAESGEIPPKGTLRSGDSFYKKFETSMINATTSAATPEEVRQILASIGSQRLDHVMSKVLDRVRTQLVYFAKDELYQKTMRRVEAVYPKKEPGKKSPRGRLEAAAYRTLACYRQMLDAQSQAKAEAMTTLEALYNQEEDEEKRQEHERDILAWKTYGDYAGMSLPQAREAMEKLLEFILSGRNSWERKLTREAGRIKYAARQIQKNLPAVNSGSSRAGAKISHRTKLHKLLSSLPYSFMSYAQLMLALEPVLGQRFSRARIKEITEANASLLNASNDRSAWLSDTIRRIAGVKSESAAEQWLVQFNTPQATGIPIAPVLTVKVSLSIEDAQEWLSLSSQEREARRQAIREEDRRTETLTETLTENVPGEEDIPLLRQALDEYEFRTPEQRQYQHNVTSKREVPNTEAASQLICSRDCALYAILLHEQPDYADVYDSEGNLIRKGFLRREGLDDKGIGDLYDYVGPDGLEYGYALRRKLNETGLTLAQVYEERMGVPFTLKPDYFRATFDRNSTREKDALTEPKTGSIGGGKYGLLIDRVVHSENLDFSKSGTLVFLAAAAEQDNYIYTSHITTAWRALLKNKPLEQKLKQHLGEDMIGKLSSWMDLIDGASLENNRAFLNLSRMQGMLQKAFAISVLAGNGYVLLKQATAILHGFFAGWVPSAILEKADGTRELAHKHISFSSFLFHLAASKLGLGDIAMKEVAATPYFTARMRGEGAMLAQLGNQMPGQRYSRMEKLPEKSMDLIEAVDVKANLLAMHALANAYYARSRSLNRENGSPFTNEELRQATLEQVGISLELGAQPLTKTQKSMSQAAGGILSKLTFVMKSEQLNKIGLMAAEWKTGSSRNRVCAAQSWLALGVTSSLLAWFIAWIKGMEDDDDDKAKKWKKYGATALLGDLTTIPLAGEGVNYLASLFTGEHVFADSYARTLIDVQGIARTITREYEHVADKKEMDWDTHFNNLTALVRAAGVGGAFSRSSSAIVSSYGALSLSAATGANISRTAKDLLTRLFGTPEEDRKKKKKKRKRKPKK